MNSLKSRIALLCTIGIYAMGSPALAQNETKPAAGEKDKSLTAIILSLFDTEHEKKQVGPEISLLDNPPKEKADKYITLSEPAHEVTFDAPDKKLSISQSFTVTPSLVFNMGSNSPASAAPSGLLSPWASTGGNRLTFSYGSSGLAADPNAVNISIGSQYLIEPSSILSPLYDDSDLDMITNREVYNLSFDVGYAGFTLGASYSKEIMLNEPGMRGYDIGLGYNGSKWGADVKFGEYSRQRALLFSSTEEFYDTIYALEIGAAYQIHSNIRFTGRFTYYAYGQDSELEKLRSSQVFFLGTNVNF